MDVDPQESHLGDLARLVDIPVLWFDLPHLQFTANINQIASSRVIFKNYVNIERRIVLGCVEKNKHRWDECFAKHAGSYYMYSRILSQQPGAPISAAVSLLRIIEKTQNGISFDLYNVDTRQSEAVDYYYRGLMFPISECLSFYGEEKSMDEPFSMVTSAAQVPQKSILAGHFSAVAVYKGMRKPDGSRVALRHRSGKMLDFKQEASRIGIVGFESLPKDIQELI